MKRLQYEKLNKAAFDYVFTYLKRERASKRISNIGTDIKKAQNANDDESVDRLRGFRETLLDQFKALRNVLDNHVETFQINAPKRQHLPLNKVEYFTWFYKKSCLKLKIEEQPFEPIKQVDKN